MGDHRGWSARRGTLGVDKRVSAQQGKSATGPSAMRPRGRWMPRQNGIVRGFPQRHAWDGRWVLKP